MQIAHSYANGDVLAILRRSSENQDQLNEFEIRARIPYDRLTASDELTTDDLLDVRMVETRSPGNDIVTRNSSGWEDEYALRLSGFDEVKSKQALELADQRQRLQEAQEKLESKVKSFGEERRQFAKQRDDLNKKKADSDAKLKSLEAKVEEQETTIQSQNEKLQDGNAKNDNAKGDATKAKAPPKTAAKTDAGGASNG
jgi:flagellar motility protein MotE (MotC chaperone)